MYPALLFLSLAVALMTRPLLPLCVALKLVDAFSVKLHLRDDQMNGRTRNRIFGQLIINKIIKIIATRCHMLRIKCTKFDSLRLSVRQSV